LPSNGASIAANAGTSASCQKYAIGDQAEIAG
jgi:hypothetical protein